MADQRHEPTHRTGRFPGHRSLAVIVAVKVAIVVAVLALPSWLAISLGAAHGVALVLVAVAAATALVVQARRRRRASALAVPARSPHPGEPVVLTAESRVETANASRYLVHFCRHATKIGRRHGNTSAPHARPEVLGVESSDSRATLTLSWGRCVLDAGPTALTVRVEAGTEAHLRAIQHIVATDLERFGHRDGVVVTWA